MKTFLPKDPGANREWLLVDAADRPLGRLAVSIANALRGKDKPTYSPQVDTGAFVVVVNAAKVMLTGRKETQKVYQRFTGFWDGRKTATAADVRAKAPDRMIRQAVQGMLPGNTLCRGMMSRLKVYAAAEHPHAAQNPRKVEFVR